MFYNTYMRTQIIHTRRIPNAANRLAMVHVKPVFFLTCTILVGAAMLFTKDNSVFVWVGLWLVIAAVYAQLFMPEKILIIFYDTYLVLFNQRSNDECTIVYYDEIVNWQYEYHNVYDEVVFFMTDGSIQRVDMYSKRAVTKKLNRFLPGKEIRTSRIKEDIL